MTSDPPKPDASPSGPLRVTLFDYGVGNLHSIKKALERSGAHVTVTTHARDLLTAEAIVLPGVGAFGASMRTLQDTRHELRAHLENGAHCLAVCIGMQLLFESSEESPGVEGLGLFKGHIRALPPRVGKIPHLGWNTLQPPTTHTLDPKDPERQWTRILPPDSTYVYFVHSYYADVEQDITLASTRYGENGDTVEIPAVVARWNTLATQFHPEKSSTPGLRFIEKWVQRVQQLQTPAPPETQKTQTAKGTQKTRAVQEAQEADAADAAGHTPPGSPNDPQSGATTKRPEGKH